MNARYGARALHAAGALTGLQRAVAKPGSEV
jgi:hypothetical protein